MNFRSVLLVLIGLNLCLAATLFHGLRSRGDAVAVQETAPVPAAPYREEGADTDPRGDSGAKPVGGDTLRTAEEEEPQRPRSPGETPGKTAWRHQGSGDLVSYVADLRAIGCPEEVIQDVIIGEVNRRFAPRERELKAERQDHSPWDEPPSHPLAVLDRKLRLRGLWREKRSVLADALGHDVPLKAPAFCEPPGAAKQEAALEALPGEKRARVRAIHDLYWEKADEIGQRTLGIFEQQDRDELRRLKAGRRAALAGVLTPSELEDFELETSRAADLLRARLKGVELSEEEFRAVFRLVQAEETGAGLPESLDAKIRAAVGDERYSTLQLPRRLKASKR